MAMSNRRDRSHDSQMHCDSWLPFLLTSDDSSEVSRDSGAQGRDVVRARKIVHAVSQGRPQSGHFVAIRASSNGLVDLSAIRSEEHTSELQSLRHLVCRL